MPSRKQRRRRSKLRRHEYEYVYVDDEGREVEVDPSELKTERPAEPRRQPRTGLRHVEPPSWRRVIKRGALFAPFMFLMLVFLEPDMSIIGRIAYTVWLLTIFIPFSYLMDRTVYRRYLKRAGVRQADAR